jgi:hypothetical protein
MAEKDTLIIYDAATKEVTERELTSDEIAQRKLEQADEQARQQAAQARIDARQSARAKLAALGLTEDEIAAL